MHPPESAIVAPSPEPGTHRTAEAAEATAAFLLRLRAKGVRDLAVLRALEAVPRELFVPHRYADLAAKDVALPIPCGQVMTEPFVLARMAEALDLGPTCRLLEIGCGSGYACAVLARLASSVVSVERYRSLAAQARTRLGALGIANVTVHWGDGLALPPEAGLFDRIVVHACLDQVPEDLSRHLSDQGTMVFGAASGEGPGQQMLVRARRGLERGFTTEPICRCRLRPLEPGKPHEL